MTDTIKKGYTTGTTATAAAKAALINILTGDTPSRLSISLPSGDDIEVPVESYGNATDNEGFAAVIKDSAGDYDVTHGAKICANVKLIDNSEIIIKGGTGVGTVTKAGLPIAIGECAINPVPREMIRNEVSRLLPNGKGAEVTISVPRGEELANKTLNAKLGIIGGISIIGTTGIVMPKSLDAYKKSLAVELDVIKASRSDEVTLLLGYVGERYRKEVLKIDEGLTVKVGDHVGFMLEECVKRDLNNVILVGHIGKIVKLTNGQFNTHTNSGDERISTLTKYAKRFSSDQKMIDEIKEQVMAEAVIDIIRRHRLMNIFDEIAKDAVSEMNKLTKNQLKIDCTILSLDAEAIGSYKMAEDQR
ncbi:cobalt-precorrin-5B (C(1))-methyltransferase CbiD [Thermodesulfobacteriota bacterium]